MMRLFKNLFLLAVSAVLSYLLLLHRAPDAAPPAEPAPKRIEMAVAPATQPRPPPPAPAAPPVDPAPAPEAAPTKAAVPPPEAGTPEGEAEPEAPAPAPGDEAERIRAEIAALAGEEDLVRRAEAEVSGRTRRGFRTVFLCAARDQVRIARAFDEPLLLVPRAGLDPQRPHYFRYRADRGTERVDARPPLERYRQYRNLFTFAYEDLPPPLRELRRQVPNRGDVYLFAALIPPSEWAVVMARRAAALAAHGGGRTPDDLRKVTMRYVPLPGGGFDIRVAELLFADGARWTPES